MFTAYQTTISLSLKPQLLPVGSIYVTTSTEGNIENSIWPGSGNTVDMQADQSVTPKIVVDFSHSQNISLWDKDFSGDDLLGSVTIFGTEQGQGEIAKLAKSTVESSYDLTLRGAPYGR